MPEEYNPLSQPRERYFAGRKPAKAPPPMSLNERLESKVTLFTDRLYERRKALHTATGEPFQSEDVSLEERKQQYRGLKSSPILFTQALASHMVIGQDGRLRINNKLLEALQELADGV